MLDDITPGDRLPFGFPVNGLPACALNPTPNRYATVEVWYRDHLAPATGLQYYPITPCLKYMAKCLVDDAAFSNLAWAVSCTEHAVLLAVT